MAHNSCNLKLRTQTFTPIFFHNLSKYDAHHLLKYIEIRSEEKLKVIPCNSETYISFSFFVPVGKTKDDKLLYEEFRFLDSFCFLSGSLDTLATTRETKDYIQLSKRFPKHVDILQNKGVFPYSFLDGFEKLSEKSLPHYGDQWINSLSKLLVKLMLLRRMFSMLLKFGICLAAKTSETISCCISKLMSFFWLTYLKNTADCLIRYID